MANQMNAHIPMALNGPVLQMAAVTADTGNCPTIFVGIINEGGYTDEVWNRHKSRISSLFNISAEWCFDIRVSSLGPNSHIVDVEKLQNMMQLAIAAINSVASVSNSITRAIRIVGLGVGSSQGITDAIESLLRGWNIAPNEKNVQFVAMGESQDFHYLNICKNMCLKQLCGTLQYYNTMDYSPYGYLSEGARLNNLPQEMLQQLLQLQTTLLAAQTGQEH